MSAREVTRMSKSKRRSLAAIGDSRVITGERERDPGSSVLRHTTLNSRDPVPAKAGSGNDGSSGVIGAHMSRIR